MTGSESRSDDKIIEQPEVALARWGTSVWAWLIDVMILNIALGAVFASLSMKIWTTGGFTNTADTAQ